MPVLKKKSGRAGKCKIVGTTNLHSRNSYEALRRTNYCFIRSAGREGINNACYPGTIENDCNRAHPGFHYTLRYHAKNHHYCYSVSNGDDHRHGDQFHRMVNAEAGSGGGRRSAGNSPEETVIFFGYSPISTTKID